MLGDAFQTRYTRQRVRPQRCQHPATTREAVVALLLSATASLCTNRPPPPPTKLVERRVREYHAGIPSRLGGGRVGRCLTNPGDNWFETATQRSPNPRCVTMHFIVLNSGVSSDVLPLCVSLSVLPLSTLKPRSRHHCHAHRTAPFCRRQVLEGMFGVAQRLFGVSVLPTDGEAQVWHPDVEVFAVRDSHSGGEVEHLSLLLLMMMLMPLLSFHALATMWLLRPNTSTSSPGTLERD